MPIDFGLVGVTVSSPSGQFSLKLGGIWEAPVETLPGKGTEFSLCHVQPAPVFRGVVKL